MIVAGQAHADLGEGVLFSQFMDPSSIDDGYIVSSSHQLAQRFTLNSPATIGSIEVIGIYLRSIPDLFQVELYADGDGLPGALYTSATVEAVESTPIVNLFNYPAYRQKVVIEPVDLAAGSYWIKVGNDLQVTPADAWAWASGVGSDEPAANFGIQWAPLEGIGFSLAINSVPYLEPRVSTVHRQLPLAEHTNADTLTFRVTFNKNVTNVDANDFIVNGADATVSTLVRVGPFAYDVTISGLELAQHNGPVSLALAPYQNIVDIESGHPVVDDSPISMPQAYILDNEPPSISVSLLGSSTTMHGPVVWQVTYTGASGTSLNAGHILPVQTGSASAAWSVGGSGSSFSVLAYGITGNGSLSFEIAAGTAIDQAGNTAPSAGPAIAVTVSDGITDSNGNVLINGTPIGVSEGYTIVFNQAPSAPSLLGPVAFDGDRASTGRTLSLRPVLTWEVPNDEDGDELHFIVQIDRGSGHFTIADSSVDQAGFSLVFNPNEALPAVQGEGMVIYRIQPGDGFNWPDTYVWRVIAKDGSSSSHPSERRFMMIDARPDDLESAVSDDHRIRLPFLQALRREVNLTRIFYGWEPVDFSDSTVIANESPVRATHIIELREALLELPPFWGRTPHFNQGIEAHKSQIKAEDFIEIRDLLEGQQAQGDNAL